MPALPFWNSQWAPADMEFDQNFTPPDFQVKNFTLSISPKFNSFSKKIHKKWVKMEKFTPLAKILHCRRHWQHWQIPTLFFISLYLVIAFLSLNRYRLPCVNCQGGITCVAIDEASRSSKAIEKFCDKNAVIACFCDKMMFFYSYDKMSWYVMIYQDISWYIFWYIMIGNNLS